MSRFFLLLIKYSVIFAWDAATQAAFGWAGPVGGALVAVLGPRWFPTMMAADTWQDILFRGLFGGLAGWASVFVIYLVIVAPHKAYRRLRPLSIRVYDDKRSPDYAFNEIARGYNVGVAIRNRSNLHLIDCSVHVLDMIWSNGNKYDRFVEKFDIPPTTTRNIHAAYWFSREAPNKDDIDIGVIGPVSGSFGGNVQRISSPQTVAIKIQASGFDPIIIYCRIWIDLEARRLRGEQASTAPI